MQVSEAMTRECESVSMDASIRQAAQRMRDKDIGALFVTGSDGKVSGIITDRDIAIRAVAESGGLDSKVSQFMTREIISCHEDDSLQEAVELMEQEQVRRLMVCDQQGEPVGMLAQADVARALGRSELTGEMLREISRPSGSHQHARH